MTKKKVKQTKKRSSVSKPKKENKNTNYTLFIYMGLLVVGLIYVTSVASRYVDFGLDRDEAAYINFGEVLRTGGDLYQDAYSIKPPAIYYTYALANTIFGYSGPGLRWSVIFSNALAAILLFLFGYRWRGPLFGFIAAISFSFFAFNPKVFGFAALAEAYQNFFLIAAVVSLQYGIIKKNWMWFLIGGFIMTYGLLIKQNLIFAYFALSISLAWYYLIEAKERQWKPLINFVLGSAIATVLIFLPVVLQGGIDDWIYWNFSYSSKYTSSIPWEQGKGYLNSYLKFTTAFNPWMWIAGVIGIVAACIGAKSTAAKLATALFLFSAILSIFPGLRFYPHYWIYFTPILSVGCAWTFYTLFQLISNRLKSFWPHVVVSIIFIAGLFTVVQKNKIYFDSPTELMINRQQYGDNPFTETRYLGEYLKNRIKSNEELLMFGSEPEIYTYIGRATPTPYIFFAHLSKEHERKDEMVADLQAWAAANKPKYVYFSNHPFSWVMVQDSDWTIYNWATSYVRQGHKVVAVADILPQGPKILFGDDALNYQVQSQKWVKIYERIGD